MTFALRHGRWLLGVVGLVAVLQVMAQVGALGPLQNVAITVTRPIDSALTTIFQPVADFIDYDEANLRAENQRLREENADLERRLTEALVDSSRFSELEQALDLVESDDERAFQAANAIFLDREPGRSVLTIDKGASDGVEVGMVVLSPQQTLIGKVTDVVDGYARIRLIDDSRSRVNVKIRETEVAGTLVADLQRNLSIDFVQGSVSTGSDVITSGLGGGYPPNLKVGTVSEVSGSAQDLTLDVGVNPAVRLSTVSTVLVLTSFEPGVIAPLGE